MSPAMCSLWMVATPRIFKFCYELWGSSTSDQVFLLLVIGSPGMISLRSCSLCSTRGALMHMGLLSGCSLR